jgi:hypothetical protein
VVVTTAVINPGKIRFGIPDILVAPTLTDWLTGRDPVLTAALAYGGESARVIRHRRLLRRITGERPGL